MIVIADTSPLVALINIDHVHILPDLFGSLIIPTEVAAELAHPNRPHSVRNFIAGAPAWLATQKPSPVLRIPGLHAGEQEAISLAVQLRAHLLLIDDRDGHRAASRHRITTIRTAALLALAADRGLIDLKEAYGRLSLTDFRVPRKVLDGMLQQHLERRDQTTRRQS